MGVISDYAVRQDTSIERLLFSSLGSLCDFFGSKVYHLLAIAIGGCAVIKLKWFEPPALGASSARANVAVPYETTGGSFGRDVVVGSVGLIGGRVRSGAGLLVLLLVLDEILGVEKWH